MRSDLGSMTKNKREDALFIESVKIKKGSHKKKVGKKKMVKKGSTLGLEGILELVTDISLSPAVQWYVRKLAEVYEEIDKGKAPKVRLEILQEIRDLVIPHEEKKTPQDIYDPMVEGALKVASSG